MRPSQRASYHSLNNASSNSAAWASTKAWGQKDDEDDEPIVRRDKYGKKIIEPPKPKKSVEEDDEPIVRRDKYGKKIIEPPKPKVKEAGAVGDFGLVNGQQGLAKKVVKVGDGSRGAPPKGARVTVHAVGHLPLTKDGGRVINPSDGVKFYSTKECLISPDAHITSREVNSMKATGPQEFVLGAGSVVPAWDMAVPSMLVGEVCELVVSPEHAYGEEGAEHLGVPPNMPVVFVLELLDWKEHREPRESMSDPDRFAMASELKFRGTEMFKQKRWDEARELYDDAAYYLSDAFLGDEYIKTATSIEHHDNPLRMPQLTGDDDDEPRRPPPMRFGDKHEEAKTMCLACMLNGSQCALKAEAWREAEKRASSALMIDPKNVKGLFRRGTAHTRLGDYNDARDDLRRACTYDPKNKEIREMFDECNIAQSAEKEAQRAFYSGTNVAKGGYEAPPEPEPEKLFVC